MISSPNAMIEVASLIEDAFENLSRATDMIEPGEDHRKLVRIRSIILDKILVHRPFVETGWLKEQAYKADEYLGQFEN